MFLPTFITLFFLFSSGTVQKGKLNGNVTDAETKEALIGVHIYIESIKLGAVSDAFGNFSVESIEAGIYTVKVSYVGYKELLISDVIIKSNRITNLRYHYSKYQLKVKVLL